MTKIAQAFFLLALTSALPKPASAQGMPQAAKDPQAVMILARSLQAAGGAQAIGTIQDFTASGRITYFWAGSEVNAPVHLRGLGADSFRMDANLSNGTRSWAVDSGSGALKEPEGKKTSIPFQNGLNLGSLSLPYFSIANALNDPSTGISLVGVVTSEGRQAYQIRISRIFGKPSAKNPDSQVVIAKDYFVDASTYLVLGTQELMYPLDSSTQTYQHRIRFGDFRQIGQLLVPFSMTEEIAGQRTWTIQLDSISFNTGLTEVDFQF